MTQIYSDAGVAVPATAVAVRGNIVTQVRTKAADGYEAVQIGEGTQNVTRISKAEDRKSTRLNSSHLKLSRMPSSA